MSHLNGRFHTLAPALAPVGALLLAAGLGLGAVATTTSSASAAPADPTSGTTAPKTIVAITGDKADGFEIEHYDGTFLYPPTDSEAAAECGEYDTRIARVRCHVEVRTWYRDLGRTQAALAYAHSAEGQTGQEPATPS